ncbi:hypothetical protein Back11_28990 [Paenibacillus baekrokdamisoli]|uniref:Uncharacterized protein n=1 Tax=Paenibacillus baekrokdamisoli TaxID=1712516 RepID=A0A3G9JED1_9BACL|nr:DUF4838 domain-containing protein [Paenibacillus baekrokdamisoli]MBB3071135.1 hypothetical protein [Paenibacillus baekrokdamisoli]BBH21554.1 hypothetical protein Back11_28990 [Paenibacillus baekrokdamisoli]
MKRFGKKKSGIFRMRQCTALITMLCLLFSSYQPAFGAANSQDHKAAANDIAGHWAERQLTEWLDKGMIRGFPDGSLRPDQSITRGELAALINRAFGFEAADSVSFTDMTKENWAYRDMTIAVKAGYLQGYGNGGIGAGIAVSRQEAAVVIARLLQLDLTLNAVTAEAYTDADQIAAWSKGAIGAASAGKLMKGYTDGSFKPKSLITRAEMVVVLDRVMAENISTFEKAGTYGPAVGTKVIKGDVIINVPGVTLRNMTISGNLLVAEGVGEGDAFLDNVTVKGTTTVKGGGASSVHFNNSELNIVRIEKTSGGVRVVLEGKTTVIEMIISPVLGAGSTVVIDNESSIVSLFLNEMIKVLGQGKIERAIYGQKGKGTTFERKPDKEEGQETEMPTNGGSTTTPEPPATPATLVKERLPKADILVSPLASKMEMLAAEELQSTIKKVSEAELPIYKGQMDGDTVSAQLWDNEMDINKVGTYPIRISLINNSSRSVRINLTQTDSGPITTNMGTDMILKVKQSQTVEGTFTIPADITEGTHVISLQVSTDDSPITVLTLKVNLDRNLIKNGGFEKAAIGGNLPEDWIVPSGARDNQVAHSGTSSLRIDLGQNDYINATTKPHLILERGREYVLKAWVKGSAPTGQKIVTQFMEMKNDGGYQDGSGQQVTNITDQWTLVELKYTPSKTHTFDYNWVYFYAVKGTDHLWIDDVTVMETGETPAPEPEPTPNLISNAGFETATTDGLHPVGWIVPSGAWDNQVAHSGTSSLRIDLGQHEYINATTEQHLMLERGSEYTLKAWVKGSAPTGQKIIMQFTEVDKDGGIQDGSGQQVTNITDQWTQVELKYTPSQTNTFEYNWIFFYIVAGTDHLWIDDVTLTKTASQQQNTVNSQDAEESQIALQTSVKSPEVSILSADSGADEDRFQIILGTPDSYPNLTQLFGDDMAYLSHSDGFAVRKAGNRIYIIGTEPKGVLNGVYDFLEKNAGVLWTRSSTTDIGTLYDPLPSIVANKVNYREKSPFQLRGFNLTGFGANGEYHEDPGTETMIARNKMNAKLAEFANQPLWERHESVGVKSFTLGHNLGYWLPNEDYFAAHPEYYNTDISGEHYIPVADDTQINFYNPDVPGVIAGRVKQFLSEHPIEYVGIGINDTHYFQQGELSRSPFTTVDNIVIQPDEADYKSTVFYSFLNKIAAKVKVTNPNAKIVTFAYFFTDTPPRVKLEDNIVVVLAPLTGDDRVPFNTSDVNSGNYGHRLKLEGWLKNTKNVVMYNYYGSFLSDTYERPIAQKVQADMKYYRDMGITGVLPESIMDARIPNWSINALQFWLFQKLMWNPDADLEQLKSDYIRKAYGAAAAKMREYYDLIEQGWNKYNDPIGYNTSTNTYIGKYIIKAGIKDAAQKALNEAWALADDKAKARIEPIKTTFEKMVLELSEIPYLEVHASKTTASKADIVNVTDFSQGPWADAKAVSEFYEMNSKNPAPVQTKVRLLWDDKNLYVGYENFDDNPSAMITSDAAPSEWWASGADDDNETFITGHPAAATYYGFFNNSKALKVEYSGPTANSAYNGLWEAYTKKGTDRWISVQVIPFDSINVDLSITKALQGYFFRTYHGKTGFYGWGVGAVWSSSSFHPILLDDN